MSIVGYQKGYLEDQIQKEKREKMKEGGKEKGDIKANIHKLLAHGNYFQQNDTSVPEVD